MRPASNDICSALMSMYTAYWCHVHVRIAHETTDANNRLKYSRNTTDKTPQMSKDPRNKLSHPKRQRGTAEPTRWMRSNSPIEYGPIIYGASTRHLCWQYFGPAVEALGPRSAADTDHQDSTCAPCHSAAYVKRNRSQSCGISTRNKPATWEVAVARLGLGVEARVSVLVHEWIWNTEASSTTTVQLVPRQSARWFMLKAVRICTCILLTPRVQGGLLPVNDRCGVSGLSQHG